MTHKAPRLFFISIILASFLTGCFHGDDETTHDDAPTIDFSKDFVTEGSDSTVTATSDINLDGMTLVGTVTVANDTGGVVSKIEIRDGIAGTDGSTVVELTEGSNGVWSVPTDATATITHDPQHGHFNAGHFYVSVLDADGNELIRGQIMPHGLYTERLHLMAMTGVTTDGMGHAFVTTDAGSKLMSVYVHTHMLMNITAMHIYNGDDSDALVLSLEEDADTGIWSAADTLTDAEWTALEGEHLYLVVETEANADGELQGTIKIEMEHHDDMTMDDDSNTDPHAHH